MKNLIKIFLALIIIISVTDKVYAHDRYRKNIYPQANTYYNQGVAPNYSYNGAASNQYGYYVPYINRYNSNYISGNNPTTAYYPNTNYYCPNTSSYYPNSYGYYPNTNTSNSFQAINQLLNSLNYGSSGYNTGYYNGYYPNNNGYYGGTLLDTGINAAINYFLSK